MSLPTASQNTQYYLEAGYGLACAVASAEMALFGEAFAEAASSFVVGSVWGVVFCGRICLGRHLLRYDPFGASSFWFDPFGALSFAV